MILDTMKIQGELVHAYRLLHKELYAELKKTIARGEQLWNAFAAHVNAPPDEEVARLLAQAVSLLRTDKRKGDKAIAEARRLTEQALERIVVDQDRRKAILFDAISDTNETATPKVA